MAAQRHDIETGVMQQLFQTIGRKEPQVCLAQNAHGQVVQAPRQQVTYHGPEARIGYLYQQSASWSQEAPSSHQR